MGRLVGRFKSASDAGDGLLESVLLNRFEEIVDGVDFEGFHGVLIVGGNEDDLGKGSVCFSECGKNAKAVELRHLNVEKNKLWRQLLNFPDRFVSALTFRANNQVLDRFREHADAFTPERFVVDDDRTHISGRSGRPRDFGAEGNFDRYNGATVGTIVHGELEMFFAKNRFKSSSGVGQADALAFW